MPTPASVAAAITTMRTRLGDNVSGAYFADDTAMGEMVTAASRDLSTYYRKEAEDATTPGNGSAIYTIPAAINPTLITDVWIRSNDDPRTDRAVRTYRKHHGQLILPINVASTDDIVYWYHRAYVIGTDDLPDHVQELFYDLVARRWYDLAIARRSDWQQWAAVNRSDGRIGEMLAAKDSVNRRITETANAIGNGITVGEVGGGW